MVGRAKQEAQAGVVKADNGEVKAHVGDVKAHVGDVSVAEIRKDFPILATVPANSRNGEPIAYLDNAATTQKPLSVVETLSRFYLETNANVHRALYAMGEEATAAFEGARRKVQRFINAARPSEIVYTHGTTEGINLVAYSWGRANVHEGDEILLSEMEHHSNLVPWQLLARERGARLRFIPFREDGSLDLEQLDGLISKRTRLVALVHLSNVFGTVNDIRRVIEAAHARSIPVLIDGAQSVPHLPIDVQALDCDFLAFSGHKMCGPTGVGILYGKEKLLEEMPPFLGGGEMIEAVWLDHATWNELPYKFEAGTQPIAETVGLGAAVDYLGRLGMENIAAYERELTAYAEERLDAISGLSLYGHAGQRAGVFSFNVEGMHSHDVAQYLDTEGICVRSGHHCAHPIMRRLGVPSTARASLYFYNTREEVDRLADALGRAKEFFENGI